MTYQDYAITVDTLEYVDDGVVIDYNEDTEILVYYSDSLKKQVQIRMYMVCADFNDDDRTIEVYD